MTDAKVWRSLLFIPANSWKMLNKAATEIEDGVLIDLEDACPLAEREMGRIFARDMAPLLKARGIDVLVRVNALSTGVTGEDLHIVVTEALDGIMLPKSESGEDIQKLASLLGKEEEEKGIKKRIAILPLIESPKGVINAYQIGTASDRVAALGFGAGDFMRELGEGFTIAKMTPDDYFPVLLYARSAIATAACAIGIPAIDTPYFGILIDTEGLQREASKAKLLGFKGKMVTHPRHVEIVNHVFTPTPDDIAFSQTMVEAYKEAEMQGKGTAVLDGRMIDVAMYKMGMDMLAKAERIASKSKLRGKGESDLMWIPEYRSRV
ncbi:MAG: CoA ester lyase [Pseudomonadota bacterium]